MYSLYSLYQRATVWFSWVEALFHWNNYCDILRQSKIGQQSTWENILQHVGVCLLGFLSIGRDEYFGLVMLDERACSTFTLCNYSKIKYSTTGVSTQQAHHGIQVGPGDRNHGLQFKKKLLLLILSTGGQTDYYLTLWNVLQDLTPDIVALVKAER